MYKAVYKCRLCGRKTITENTIEGKEVKNAIADVATIGYYSEKERCGLAISRNSIHNCQDGSFGLADFQGFEKTEE